MNNTEFVELVRLYQRAFKKRYIKIKDKKDTK